MLARSGEAYAAVVVVVVAFAFAFAFAIIINDFQCFQYKGAVLAFWGLERQALLAKFSTLLPLLLLPPLLVCWPSVLTWTFELSFSYLCYATTHNRRWLLSAVDCCFGATSKVSPGVGSFQAFVVVVVAAARLLLPPPLLLLLLPQYILAVITRNARVQNF